MKLNNIKGNTHWIRGGTNTGIYVFEDNTVLLIDPGISGSRQEKIIKLLDENNLQLRYIFLTHEHEDHVGGITQLRKKYIDVTVISTNKAKILIENPDLYMDSIIGGRRPQELMDVIYKYISEPHIDDRNFRCVDEIVFPNDKLEIKGHTFNIFNCAGHTEGCVGIVTDDGVAFLGDLLITKNSLDKFDFLFMCDCNSQLKSLDNLRIVDLEVAILGHSSVIFSKQEALELADYNNNVLMEHISFILTVLEKPITFDELIGIIVREKNLRCNYIAYIEYRNSLNALISYLLDKGAIKYVFDNFVMKYVISTEEKEND